MVVLPGGVRTERTTIPTLLGYLIVAIACGYGASQTNGWVRAGLLVPTVILGAALIWTIGFIGLVTGLLNLMQRRLDPHGPTPRQLARDMEQDQEEEEE